MIAAFAGIATAGSVPAAGAAPMPGVGSIVQDVVDGTFNTGMSLAAVTNTVVRPAAGELTSGYGPRWGRMHNGIDIANAVGTPIYAVMSGTVIDSGPASGYGNWIRIRHNDGSVSVYGHMETLSVSVGQTVGAGEYIAGMGNRGQSTGSHLHFEIHPDGSTPVDPEPWFAEHGIYF
ncbi:M23 family metallopeptidase [Corynebacterium freneyi]|nr:M23 family metallopeptidase [Corynebacterium freneyi]MDK8767625.1 M23 family metallopeptidase [Corynebacterium freneyi]